MLSSSIFSVFILLHIWLGCPTTQSCEQYYHSEAFPVSWASKTENRKQKTRILSFQSISWGNTWASKTGNRKQKTIMLSFQSISWRNTWASIRRCLARICSSWGIASPPHIWLQVGWASIYNIEDGQVNLFVKASQCPNLFVNVSQCPRQRRRFTF